MTNLQTRKKNDEFFNTLTRALIGFDNLWLPDPEGASNYPRYNLSKTENGYKLEISVVGLSKEDLEVKFKAGNLVIKGNHKEARKEAQYIHKGISTKAFERSFSMDSSLSISTVELVNGLLVIDFQKETEDEYLLEIK